MSPCRSQKQAKIMAGAGFDPDKIQTLAGTIFPISSTPLDPVPTEKRHDDYR